MRWRYIDEEPLPNRRIDQLAIYAGNGSYHLCSWIPEMKLLTDGRPIQLNTVMGWMEITTFGEKENKYYEEDD